MPFLSPDGVGIRAALEGGIAVGYVDGKIDILRDVDHHPDTSTTI